MMLPSENPNVVMLLGLDGTWTEEQVDGDISYGQGAVVDAKFFLGESGCSIV